MTYDTVLVLPLAAHTAAVTSDAAVTLVTTEQQRCLVQRYAVAPLVNNLSREQICFHTDRSALDTKENIPSDRSLSVISPVDPKTRHIIANKRELYDKLIQIGNETGNVIRHHFVELCQESPRLRVFVESEGNYQVLSSMITKLPRMSALVPTFTAQILQGLAVLHRHGIVHKDIRCASILVQKCLNNGKPAYLLKITHFEKASLYSSDATQLISYPEGSSRFASKEMQQLLSFNDAISEADTVGTATDIYSLGCTVIEMYEKSPPNWIYRENGKVKQYNFKPDGNEADFLANLRNLFNFGAEPDTSVLEARREALDFVRSCFVQPSSLRPACRDLLMHPFISPLDR